MKEAGKVFNVFKVDSRCALVALDKALKCFENSCWVFVAREPCIPVLGAFSNGWRRLPPKSVGEVDLGGRLALLGSDG